MQSLVAIALVVERADLILFPGRQGRLDHALAVAKLISLAGEPPVRIELLVDVPHIQTELHGCSGAGDGRCQGDPESGAIRSEPIGGPGGLRGGATQRIPVGAERLRRRRPGDRRERRGTHHDSLRHGSQAKVDRDGLSRCDEKLLLARSIAGLGQRELMLAGGDIGDGQGLLPRGADLGAIQRHQRPVHVRRHLDGSRVHRSPRELGQPSGRCRLDSRGIGIAAGQDLRQPELDPRASDIEHLDPHRIVVARLLDAAVDEPLRLEALAGLGHAAGGLVGAAKDQLHLDEILSRDEV